jgi:hypothetical protein
VTEASDPDPFDLAGEHQGVTFGGRAEPGTGDPTAGGKQGQVGEVDSIAADEPADGSHYAVGGGRVGEESDAVPVSDPGPDGTP